MRIISATALALIAAVVALPGATEAQTPDQVLVVVNRQSNDSREIGRYYMQKRRIPPSNLCTINTKPVEWIDHPVFYGEIRMPIGRCLTAHGLVERILYIVTTKGVPLSVGGNNWNTLQSEAASVDSELTLLYQVLHGQTIPLAGPLRNPFFGQRDTPFRHPTFPMYLVNRLTGYDMRDMKGLVDRALLAKNKGNFVIDVRADNDTPGNQWLRAAALLLPKDRLVMDDSPAVLKNQKDVIAYASWGSNDRDRRERMLNFQWLPGAIATEFVSTDGRTFDKPPDNWQLGNWGDQKTWWHGGPQTLTADYIHEGASGASGQVTEPFLGFCPRPDYILPAYHSGRNLAESFYMGIPGVSWMNIVVGDPLMHLAP